MHGTRVLSGWTMPIPVLTDEGCIAGPLGGAVTGSIPDQLLLVATSVLPCRIRLSRMSALHYCAPTSFVPVS